MGVEKGEVQRGYHCVWQIHYHIVFPVKYRRVLLDEEVVKIMGIGDPVGKNFRFMGLRGIIIGVLKNFHFKGADQPIEPIAFALADTSYLSYILIRLTPGNLPGSLKSVEKVWKEVVPEYPLQYTFIDQDYENLFRSQIRLTELLKYFTILSLIIACLGLYGLSAYSAERRTNEIGIKRQDKEKN